MSVATVEHHGVSVAVPEGWEVLRDPRPDVDLIALEPPREGFRANLVLTATDTTGLDFGEWQRGTDEALPRHLRDHLLLDAELLTVGGHPGGRRLVHHVAGDGSAVTLEQWFAQVGDTGWTLTSSVDSWRHHVLRPVLLRCVQGLVLPR